MRTDIIATALILVGSNLLYRHRMILCGSLCVWMAVLGSVVGGEGLDLDRAVIVGSAALILERSQNRAGDLKREVAHIAMYRNRHQLISMSFSKTTKAD